MKPWSGLRWWVYTVACLGVLGAGLLGAAVGWRIGEASCDDSRYELLRCLDEDVAGLELGGVAGLAVGLGCSLLWIARMAGRPSRDAHR